MEFVEDQDPGFQAVEQVIDLFGLAADIPAVAGRRAQRLQDASIEMGKAGALSRLHHPDPLPLDGSQMPDGEPFRHHGVLNATPPMFVLLIVMTTGFGGQRITMQKIAGVVVGLAGVVITTGIQSLGQANTAAPLAQAAVPWGESLLRIGSHVGTAFCRSPRDRHGSRCDERRRNHDAAGGHHH